MRPPDEHLGSPTGRWGPGQEAQTTELQRPQSLRRSSGRELVSHTRWSMILKCWCPQGRHLARHLPAVGTRPPEHPRGARKEVEPLQAEPTPQPGPTASTQPRNPHQPHGWQGLHGK